MKQISETDIENLKTLIRNRNSYLDIKEVLDNLTDSKDELIIKDLKDLLHKGKRSQIHEFEIRDIINKYGEENGKH